MRGQSWFMLDSVITKRRRFFLVGTKKNCVPTVY